MPIQPTSTGIFEGLTVSDLKARSLDRLKQKAANYDRYSETSILNAINDTEVEIARMTRCLRGFAFIVLKEGYSQYKAPSDMLLPDKAFFYQSQTSYWELKQKSRAWLDRFNSGWRTVTGDPTHMFMGDNYGNIRKVGFYPQPDTDSGFELDSEYGTYEKESSMSPSGNVSGTNSAASATVLTDTDGRTLEDEGVTVGMMVVNVTDGSSGQITAMSGSTVTCTLTGGTNNTWAIGDSFTILAGEYGVVTEWEEDESYVFTTDYGVLAGVTQENNVYLEYIKRPPLLTVDGQRPMVPPELHQYIPDNVLWILKRNAPRNSQDFQESTTGRQTFLQAIMAGYIDQDDILEDSGFTEFRL